MIYGDNPQKINEREDALGLKRYSYAPQISAVIQSGNLYAYCGGNPVERFDYSGGFFISTALLLIAGGALLGGVIGGLVGNHVANEKGATGWEKVGYIVGGAAIGGAIGAIAGAVAAPVVTSATGVAGISVSSAGISAISTASIDAVNKLNEYIINSGSYVAQSTGNTYYHVTSIENAKKILETGSLLPGEGGRIFVTNIEPTLKQVQELGSYASEVVIQFKSATTIFIPDTTVSCIVDGALMTSIPGMSIEIFEPIVRLLQ